MTENPKTDHAEESIEDWWNQHHAANHAFWLSGYRGVNVWQPLEIMNYIRPGKVVLNIGIGLGYCTQDLVSQQAVVHVLDISTVALEKVKPIVAGTWLPGQLDELPSNYFDLAISHLVTQHMNDQDLRDQLQAVIRGLKPDGIFAMQFAFAKSYNPATHYTVEDAKGGGVCRTLCQMETLVNAGGGRLFGPRKSATSRMLE